MIKRIRNIKSHYEIEKALKAKGIKFAIKFNNGFSSAFVDDDYKTVAYWYGYGNKGTLNIYSGKHYSTYNKQLGL